MKIKEAQFVISAVQSSQYPQDRLPEIALVGRSNVGKSSFINSLLQRRKLAHTSSKPGKTRTLNFYRINDQFYFVDLPGYGYAQVSQEEKRKWAGFIESYLAGREELVCVLQVVDLRHPPSKDDVMMFSWLQHMNLPTIVIATKADKIARGRWQQYGKVVRQTLGMGSEMPLILFSSETGQGKEEAWQTLSPYLQSGLNH